MVKLFVGLDRSERTSFWNILKYSHVEPRVDPFRMGDILRMRTVEIFRIVGVTQADVGIG